MYTPSIDEADRNRRELSLQYFGEVGVFVIDLRVVELAAAVGAPAHKRPAARLLAAGADLVDQPINSHRLRARLRPHQRAKRRRLQ